MRYVTRSPEETIDLGCTFAKKLKPGAVVALIGDLGSGKTVFTKGIAKALGVKEYRYVNSPSFVIMKEYRSKAVPLFHFDLYRLDRAGDMETVGYEEYFYAKGISVIEWADRALEVLPKEYIRVEFKHRGDDRRAVNITGDMRGRKVTRSPGHRLRSRRAIRTRHGMSRGTKGRPLRSDEGRAR
jgi:tRNA threonylcarbamoyladenosine biosynthesis protein TsaE